MNESTKFGSDSAKNRIGIKINPDLIPGSFLVDGRRGVELSPVHAV